MVWFQRHADQLEAVNVLELKPVRLADWEEVAGRVVVHRPAPTERGLRGALARLLHALSARRIRLDPIGSFAWNHMDGNRSVAEMAEQLRAAFGDRVEPSEERLGHMVRVLRREGLIAYPGWDDVTVCGRRI